ncbi:MAG: chorismate synthase [Bacteroidetes bacterium]|nr:chorismate synthase [Bacteroidota bacterium]
MRGNSFGNFFVLTSFGESHGPALGAVIDGCPAGVPLTEEHINAALRRRRPGQSIITSTRLEEDIPEILSGVFEGRTLGTPIAVIVRNHDTRSEDYSPQVYRAGHADRVWQDKYVNRDHRGGGRSSGRETIARVIGGAVAEQLLPDSVQIVAFARQIGHVSLKETPGQITRANVDSYPTRCPDSMADAAITEELLRLREQGDSVGGIIELRIDGVPSGLGEPVFNKAKSLLTSGIMTIGAVAGVSLGEAFTECLLAGSAFHTAVANAPEGITTRSYGIQGGITSGQRIVMRVAIKPTSTTGDLARQGRHDPCIVPRVIPVIESMAALVLADLFLASRLDNL